MLARGVDFQSVVKASLPSLPHRMGHLAPLSPVVNVGRCMSPKKPVHFLYEAFTKCCVCLAGNLRAAETPALGWHLLVCTRPWEPPWILEWLPGVERHLTRELELRKRRYHRVDRIRVSWLESKAVCSEIRRRGYKKPLGLLSPTILMSSFLHVHRSIFGILPLLGCLTVFKEEWGNLLIILKKELG